MFITAAEIRELSQIDDVKALSDVQIEAYIDRADSWINRISPAIGNTESDRIQKDLRIATWLLVEYLFYWDDPENREAAISGDESVRIGSFSYKTKASEGEKTGIKELDLILERYEWKPKIGNYFRISGPSSRK